MVLISNNNFTLDSKLTNEEKENIILSKSKGLVSTNSYGDLYNLITSLQNEIWPELSSARYFKILKIIFEFIQINQSLPYDDIRNFIESLIKKENRNLIKLDLKSKLIYLHLAVSNYKECLEQITEIIPVLKKYDNKISLILIYLYESKAYYRINNLPSAKASLSSAKALSVTAATPVYLQAEIDLLSGMYLMDEGSYDTAINYFTEVVQNFNHNLAVRYIVLCKIIKGESQNVEKFVCKCIKKNQPIEKYREEEIYQILLKVADAANEKDVILYRNIIQEERAKLSNDGFLSKFLEKYLDSLLNQNILKVIKPYSTIKVNFIADQLGLEPHYIEEKLRTMILDEVIDGILDHSQDSLIIFKSIDDKKNPLDATFTEAFNFFKKIK